MKRLLTLIAISALIASACGGATADTTFEITDDYEVLRLTGTAGSISVRGDDRATSTTIVATINYPDTQPDVLASVFGTDLIVGDACIDINDCFTDYIITVPEGTSLFIENTTGPVSIGATTGDVTVITSNGNVTATDLAGSLEVTTTEGSVLALGLSSPTAFVTTASGVIDLSFDTTIQDVRAKSVSGNITVQAPGEPYAVSAESGTGGVDVNVETDDGAAGTISAETDSGDIKIYRQ